MGGISPNQFHKNISNAEDPLLLIFYLYGNDIEKENIIG